MVQSSRNKVLADEFGLSAKFLANERARNNARRVNGLPGESVLIEYGCEDDSELKGGLVNVVRFIVLACPSQRWT